MDREEQKTSQPKMTKTTSEASGASGPRDGNETGDGRYRHGGDTSGGILSGRSLVTSFVFSIPFIAVAATTLRCGAALSFALALSLLPSTILCSLLRTKVRAPISVTIPVCTLVSMALTSLAVFAVRGFSAELSDALGVYVYLLAAYPVLAAVFAEKGSHTMNGAVLWSLRYLVRFTAAAVVISSIREILAYGQLWGAPLGWQFRISGAKMTFFGMILMGMLLAGAAALKNRSERRRAGGRSGADR